MLGPANITKDSQIPIEQCISTCKLRPGSGCLGVKILADGPTRVLQIADCIQQVRLAKTKACIEGQRSPGFILMYRYFLFFFNLTVPRANTS